MAQSNTHYNVGKPYLRLSMVIVCLSMLFGCAQKPETLYGGPKDVKGPELKIEKSFVDETLNFQQDDIILEFDEYIVLKNAIKEITVSPPLTYIPDIKARGKRIIFKFNENEKLRDSTTYKIDFGKSVSDLNEGNPLQDFSLVFSTGNYLDSMEVKGTLKDFLDGELSEKSMVAFYLNHEDSVLVKEKPYYFAKVDKDGKYNITNMKAGDYKVVAFTDENLNYLYEQRSEAIGFIDTLIAIGKDSIVPIVDLTLSGPAVPLDILGHNAKTFGKVGIKFNKVPDQEPEYRISDPSIKTYDNFFGDSLNLFYEAQKDSFQLYILQDTITVFLPDSSKISKSNRIVIKGQLQEFSPVDSLIVFLSNPIETFVKDSLSIKDTSEVEVAYDYSIDGNVLYLKGDWQDTTIYNVRAGGGFLTDIFSNASDSVRFQFRTISETDLGTLKINVVNTDSSITHILKVKQGERTLQRRTFMGQDTFTLTIPELRVQEYKLELIEDINNNGTWDPTDYWARTQAERIVQKTASSMIPNGELAVDLTFQKDAPVVSNPMKADSLSQPKIPLQKLLKEKGKQ